MSYLLVGESPNRATITRPELWLVPDESGIPHTANRLRDLAGWTTEEYLRVFAQRDNVLGVPPLVWRKKHSVAATARAAYLLGWAHIWAPKGIVCLGKRAAEAFEIGDTVPLQWDRVRVPGDFARPNAHIPVAYLPHTSGRCRWWNDSFNRSCGQDFLRRLRSSS